VDRLRILLTVRVGYVPNITHSQALAGLARGDFQKAPGSNVTIDVKASTLGRRRSKRCLPIRLTCRTF
jgi:hypothetical protein